MSWSGSPAPARDFGDLRTVLRKSSLRNVDKAGHKTGSYQARRIFQDYLLSEAPVILEVGLPLPLAVFWIWLSVDGVYWTALECGQARGDDSICARALRIAPASPVRTKRAISRPLLRNTNVGQSFTLNERPRGRPLPSAILIWRTFG